MLSSLYFLYAIFSQIQGSTFLEIHLQTTQFMEMVYENCLKLLVTDLGSQIWDLNSEQITQELIFKLEPFLIYIYCVETIFENFSSSFMTKNSPKLDQLI